MNMPQYVSPDGGGFRVRIRRKGLLYGRSFATLDEARTFAVALTLVMDGPKAIAPSLYGVTVYPAAVRDAQVLRATVRGDGPDALLALAPGVTSAVCQHINTDGHDAESRTNKTRGRFRLMISSVDRTFRRLGDALRARDAVLAKKPWLNKPESRHDRLARRAERASPAK